MPSFITCLCMMFILTAATQSLCASYGGSISMPLKMRKWESLELYAVIGIIYFAVMLIMFRYTKFGKYMKALGVSVEAARQSGIVVSKMTFLGYLLTGTAAGLAGFLTLIRVGGAATTTGQTLTTDVIIAIVFGGMSVAGGASSKISAALIGTLIIILLNNGMVMAGYGGDLQQLIKGILFLMIIAVSMKRDSNTIIK
jgi:ribose transport system permease protein